MTPQRWQQIEEVFQSALDIENPAERREFVRQNCDGDAELKREVEKLLADFDSAEGFIESPVWTDSRMFNSAARVEMASSLEKEMPSVVGYHVEDAMIGKRVGVFRLTKEIGRGGMGAVYLAERDDGEFRQRVAIKLIKRGMDTDFIVRRFRHERQILANLDHPNIARLIDGGTTEDGLPFFVMEYIEGEPLHRYCDARKLNVRQRLHLFRQICSAVHYAHEAGIVHRDIKPGNILVLPSGVPKLLDFGIAKILDPDMIHESVNPTSTMMRLMTPEYASPEQVRGLPVTATSDVYALGVLLYELLSGHRPYSFTGRAAHEIARVICESEIELPSESVAKPENLLASYAQNQITAEKAAELRSADVIKLESEIGGNLDNIILKALCKETEGRYATAKDFSEDISRHLEGATVTAEPCAISYVGNVEKSYTTDGNLTGDRSIAVLPFKLLNVLADENTGDRFLGLGLADAMITRLSNVRRFVVRPTSSVLRYGEGNFDPFGAGRELGVEFILDGHIQRAGDRIRISVQLLNVAERTTIWAERFDEKFTDVLSLEDAISTLVAMALVSRLTDDEREQLLKRGTNNADAFEAYLRGRYHWNTFTEEGFAKAIVAYNQAIALDPQYALAYAGIADYYNWLGVYGVLPANECFKAAIEAAERAISLDSELADAHASLGFAIVGGDYDWERGERECRRALELNEHSVVGHLWYSLHLTMERRFDEADYHARRGVALDPLAPFNAYNLAWVLYYARRFRDSIAQYEKNIAANPLYAINYAGLSWTLRIVGRYDEAVNAIRRAMELTTDSIYMLSVYGQTLAAAGEREEARAVLRKIEEMSANRFVSSYQTALIYNFLGDKKKTLELLEKAYEQREAWVVWLDVEPAFDNLRNESRFVRLLELTENPSFLRARGAEIEKTSTPSTQIMTGDGESKMTGETPILPKTKRNIFSPRNLAVAAVVLVCIFATAAVAMRYGWQAGWQNSVAAPQPEAQTNAAPVNSENTGKNRLRSIAILPFTTIGARTDDDQYLGVGTADLVTNKLSELKEVNLRSASSVRRFLKTSKTPQEIGRELAVDYVIGGNIERKGNQVEARLEMIDAASGAVVWSESFSAPNNNLFDLQDDISEKIVTSLSLQLTNAEKQNLARHFTTSNDAQQLYFAGRYHFGKRTVEGLHQAISLFQQAIEIDPKFALAYTGLADCNALLNWYQEPPPPDAWENAKAAATKAVTLDPKIAEAHASLAFVRFHYERNYAGAEDEFRRAINLKPNYATAHQWYAFLLSAQGRHDESVNIMRRAEELEPRSAVIALAVANVLFYARRYDEAIAQCRRALEIDPSSVGAYAVLRWNYEKKGMAQESLEVYEKELAFAGDTPTSRAKLAHVLAAIGRGDEARRNLDELIKNGQIQHVTPYEIAVIYSLLNQPDKGLEWLKKAKDTHVVGFSFVRVDPMLDNLREDPRFVELVK